METKARLFTPPQQSFFLFGPRGTGKSTLLLRHFAHALWIDLLDPSTRRRLQANPERLRELVAGARPVRDVVVDEVQRAPAILDVVHELLESREPPRFILTGSSARKLRRGAANLLAGRVLERHLHPFLAVELGEDFDLERSLTLGHLPLVLDATDPASTLASYASLHVREEVQAEGLVRDIGGFHRFLEAMSLTHGAALNVTEVARECAVVRRTVAGHLDVLEDLLLGFRLPSFRRRAKRLLTSHPKFYFFDPGVFRSLRPTGPLDAPSEVAGGALEGLVAEHLRTWIDYGGVDARLHFWRTQRGVEVDFVVYGTGVFWAIEVKSSPHVRTRDLAGLRAFLEDYPEAKACLLYRGRETLEVHGIPCVPCEDFLRELVPGVTPRVLGGPS